MGVCETTPTTFEPTGTPDTATPTEPTPTTKQSQPGSTTNHATGPAPHAPKPALDNQDPHGCRRCRCGPGCAGPVPTGLVDAVGNPFEHSQRAGDRDFLEGAGGERAQVDVVR